MSSLHRVRHESLRYEHLSLVGKVSARLSQRAITSRLRPGAWLDLLSGSQALLLQSQLQNARISEFHALDHRLDPSLRDMNIVLHEHRVDTTLLFEDASFDNVTIVNGLEHVWHPQEVLNECFRILRTGGVLQVVVPTWFGKPILELLAFRLRNPQAYVEMNDHKMYYDERTLWPMLVRAGFLPESISLRRIKAFCSLHATAVRRRDLE
jgi:SAM-dependent methyltransferase